MGLENVGISRNEINWADNNSIPKHNTAFGWVTPSETGKEVSSENWTFKIIMRKKGWKTRSCRTKVIISMFKKPHTHIQKLYTCMLMWKPLLLRKIIYNIDHDILQKCYMWGSMVLWRDIHLAKITFITMKGKRPIHQLKLQEFM